MIKYNDITKLKKNIPSEIRKFFTEKLNNYLVIIDGEVIIKNLQSSFEKLSINYNNVMDIVVPRNFSEKETLHIFYIQENTDSVINTKITLKENAELNYFEYLFSNTESKVDFVSDSYISENAKLRYSGISKFNKNSKVSVIRNSNISRYGSSIYSIAEVSDADADLRINMFLDGDYANAVAKTVAITSKKQKVRIKQIIEHNAPDTEGYIENYGVSNNDSSLIFEGVGKINKNMKRSIARQQNKGIVLGENSRLDANPLLLIDEYDVEASHGAAIGKIDEEQLYYLMSRGLTLKNAERLIISGFLSPIIKQLTTDELIEDFLEVVKRKTL
ncbi:MAG: SufD family Fe-S cluster assembly protein [Candidatus Izimaplasma sp.]|nr:SufD family Fe-S cluster assembly protein [Candidatus Izimaplasma bacterium]